VTFAIRTHLPFYRNRPGALLLWSSAAAALVAFTLPFTRPGQEFFSFVPLSAGIALLVIGIVMAYLIVVELVKAPFFRHFES
jgi:P-type Mg2+ transporter